MRKLAKQFSYTSNVVKGLKQGRLIGFPTANLKIVKPIKIKPGVYAATCKLGSKTYLGMAYYGPRYIFNNLQNNLEVFLFNFNQTIYQKKLTINLTHFVRPPVKLKNLSDIKKQLIKDQQSISDNQVVLVNKKDQIVGQTDLLSAHLGKGQLHQAISVLIFNSKKQLLLQKRSQYKPLWPLFWANSCCGNKRPGKSMYQFAKDRLKFEMGLKASIKFWYKFTYQARYNQKLSEHEIDYVYLGFSDQKPKINPQEVAEYKYLSIKEIITGFKDHPEMYAPWFKLIMKRLKTSDILKT